MLLNLGELGFVSSAIYHHRQAQTLIRLADSTRDPETAAALMRLAADHTTLAERQPVTQQQQQIHPDKANKE